VSLHVPRHGGDRLQHQVIVPDVVSVAVSMKWLKQLGNWLSYRDAGLRIVSAVMSSDYGL